MLGRGLLIGLTLFIVIGCKNRKYSAKGCKHSKKDLNCVQFVENKDGDTITVQVPNVHSVLGEPISVRIRGIDAADLQTVSACEKHVARLAKDYIDTRLSEAKRVDLKNVTRGKYFRFVADVSVDGKDLGKDLVRKKLAVFHDGKIKPDVNWCRVRPKVTVIRRKWSFFRFLFGSD